MRLGRTLAAAGLALLMASAAACGQAAPSPHPAAVVTEPTPPSTALTTAVALPPTATPPPSSPEAAQRPPLTPRWVYEPWVWEDSVNTAEAVDELVDGYRARGIPVGAVIVDSPWQTNYNTFVFGPNYPDPRGFIGELHARGIKVVVWVTGFVNVASASGLERGKAANYDEAHAAGYFVDDGKVYHWWQGDGSAIDFFNPRAVAWWYRQMDRAFALGVDGWKVDNAETALPDVVETAAGPKTREEYTEAYYRAFYRYVAERNPEAIVLARPYVKEETYAPVDAVHAGWVGDQGPNWEGLEEAIENILESAKRGYAVLGSDIGGRGDSEKQYSAELFIRWTQLGALSPLMENGGRGRRAPWELGDEVLEAYRYYAKLHHQLVPYLYSAGVNAHRTGQSIVEDASVEDSRYTLGGDLLVAPIADDRNRRKIELPDRGRWYDYWDDDRVVEGSDTVRHDRPLEQMPLFIRAGAIIPMQVSDDETGHGGKGSAGRLTLLVYPDKWASTQVYHPDAERSVMLKSQRAKRRVTVEIGPQTERYVLRIKEPGAPTGLRLARGGAEASLPRLDSWPAFDGADEGWYYDAARHYVWARFATQQADAHLTYETAP